MSNFPFNIETEEALRNIVKDVLGVRQVVTEVDAETGIRLTNMGRAIVNVRNEMLAKNLVLANEETRIEAESKERDQEITTQWNAELQSIMEQLAAAEGVVGPQGAQGEKGDQGERGIPGEKGEAGLPGMRGPAGSDGAAGAPGARGDAGPQGLPGQVGERGAIGPAGSVGPTGAKGDQGVAGPAGAVGPQGERGLPGSAGTQGAQGPRGFDGATGAQGIPGAAGAAGATGPAGTKGDTGATGATGAVGPAGPKGDKGETGSTGSVGATGPAGATGAVGSAGAKGDTGAVGPQGPAGPSLISFAPAVPARAFATNFIPHATKAVMVFYTVELTVAATVAGNQVAGARLVSDSAAVPTVERCSANNALSITLGVSVGLSHVVRQVLSYLVPAGHSVRLEKSGTGSVTLVTQAEVTITPGV